MFSTNMNRARVGTMLLSMFVAAGCAASVDKDPTKRGDLAGKPPTFGTGGGVGGGFKTPNLSQDGDCSIEAELMYLIGVTSNEAGPASLYAFEPVALVAKKLAELDGCPDVDIDEQTWPLAMSIDVEGYAWVLFVHAYGVPGSSYGKVFKVDMAGNCIDTLLTFTPPRDAWVEGGLGFIGPAVGSEVDRLYLGGVFTDSKTPRLHHLDPTTLALESVGSFIGAPSGFWPSRMAGTDDGRLYAFAGARYSEIDPVNGKLLGALGDLKLPRDRFPGSAIAYWGDDFWIFESIGDPAAALATIYRHQRAAAVTTEEGSVRLHVTAAAVTTCAPTVAK